MSDAFDAIGESRYSGSSGILPASSSRSSSQTTSWVRPIANDGTSRTPSASGDEADGLGEDADRLVLRLVLAAAVRRLDEDVVGVGHDRRVAQDRRAGPAEVAGEDDAALRRRRRGPVDPEPDDRRAEDVAGVDERRVDAGRDLELLRRSRCRGTTPSAARGVLVVVERLVEVDVEVRRLGLERLPPGRPAGAAAGPGAARSSSARARRWRHSPAAARRTGRPVRRTIDGPVVGLARRGEVDRRLEASAWSWRSSTTALSGWRFSQRASRLANSSWSLPESSRTSAASSTVPVVAQIGPRVARP